MARRMCPSFKKGNTACACPGLSWQCALLLELEVALSLSRAPCERGESPSRSRFASRSFGGSPVLGPGEQVKLSAAALFFRVACCVIASAESSTPVNNILKTEVFILSAVWFSADSGERCWMISSSLMITRRARLRKLNSRAVF